MLAAGGCSYPMDLASTYVIYAYVAGTATVELVMCPDRFRPGAMAVAKLVSWRPALNNQAIICLTCTCVRLLLSCFVWFEMRYAAEQHV